MQTVLFSESDSHENWSTLQTQTLSTIITQHTNVIDNKLENITKSCNCSKSSLFPKFLLLLLAVTTGLLLLLCLILITALCVLISYYTKELCKKAEGCKDTNLNCAQNEARFGQSHDQLVEITENLFHDKSIYLQVLSEDGSIDGNLETVVTSKSFPIVTDGVKGKNVVASAAEGGVDVSSVQPIEELNDVMEGDVSSDFVAGMKFIDETFLL